MIKGMPVSGHPNAYSLTSHAVLSAIFARLRSSLEYRVCISFGFVILTEELARRDRRLVVVSEQCDWLLPLGSSRDSSFLPAPQHYKMMLDDGTYKTEASPCRSIALFSSQRRLCSICAWRSSFDPRFRLPLLVSSDIRERRTLLISVMAKCWLKRARPLLLRPAIGYNGIRRWLWFAMAAFIECESGRRYRVAWKC